LGWEGSWYEDEDRKRTHRDLVLAGMERSGHGFRGSISGREGFPGDKLPGN